MKYENITELIEILNENELDTTLFLIIENLNNIENTIKTESEIDTESDTEIEYIELSINYENKIELDENNTVLNESIPELTELDIKHEIIDIYDNNLIIEIIDLDEINLDEIKLKIEITEYINDINTKLNKMNLNMNDIRINASYHDIRKYLKCLNENKTEYAYEILSELITDEIKYIINPINEIISINELTELENTLNISD